MIQGGSVSIEHRENGRGNTPADLLVSATQPTHRVQFYEGESFLCTAVADYLADGWAHGEPLLFIGTEHHRAQVARELEARGVDTVPAAHSGRLMMLDARETLNAFMQAGAPDPALFHSVVGGALDRSRRSADGRRVRAFGEMVDLLWRDGNEQGAIRLEELWNELSLTHGFSLLCAYAIRNFDQASDTAGFREVCHLHGDVRPTERYTQVDGETKLIEIALLQQRALALEAELTRREALEQGLREALDARMAAEAECQNLLERERVARAEAESASRAKSEFLAVMSHELRTPLNAIGGHVQLIQLGLYGSVSDGQRAALERVERSQRHLLSLINDVLNLARVEAGQVEYDLRDLEVEPLIAEVAAMLEPLVAKAGLRCEMVHADGAPDTRGVTRVHADREKTRQILLNLLTNAIKFTPAGGHITMTVSSRAGDGSLVSMSVTDTGIGIEADKLDRIFEPFVQLETRLHSRRDGVGLGLAISRDLARGMGGELTARSRPGEGSTFSVTLPTAKA